MLLCDVIENGCEMRLVVDKSYKELVLDTSVVRKTLLSTKYFPYKRNGASKTATIIIIYVFRENNAYTS